MDKHLKALQSMLKKEKSENKTQASLENGMVSKLETSETSSQYNQRVMTELKISIEENEKN